MSDQKPARPAGDLDLDQAFGGIFKGLGGLFAAFVDAVETAGKPRSGTGRFEVRERGNRNIARDPAPRWTVELPEPLIDLFDEGDAFLVVAALPATYAGELRVEVQDDILALRLTGPQAWEHEILLPAAVSAPTLNWSLRNGILELRAEKLMGQGRP